MLSLPALKKKNELVHLVDKSFLVLFFKKELLAFFGALPA
jgi:hypothetical protein